MDRDLAETYAGWFRALSDPMRVQILSLLAEHDDSRTVGEIVAAVDLAQSTVSHHLRVLHEVGFVELERVGNRSLYRVNRNCVSRFPAAAAAIIGSESPAGRRREPAVVA